MFVYVDCPISTVRQSLRVPLVLPATEMKNAINEKPLKDTTSKFVLLAILFIYVCKNVALCLTANGLSENRGISRERGGLDAHLYQLSHQLKDQVKTARSLTFYKL